MTHYTYLLTDPETNMKYIGVRSCECNLNNDEYKGSSKLMTAAEKKRSIKSIINIFNTREEAMEDEIKLHAKYNVSTNPQFWNQCNATSTGFTLAGRKMGPLSDEHKAKLSKVRTGEKNGRFYLSTKYEWVHRDSESFVGSVHEIVKHTGKDSSQFYKVVHGKALTSSGWKINKNIDANIQTTDLSSSGKKRSNKSLQKLINKRDGIVYKKDMKYKCEYLWAHRDGRTIVSTVYGMDDLLGIKEGKTRKCVRGSEKMAEGWRIVKNLTTGIVTTDLNHGRGIQTKLSYNAIK